MQNPTLQKKKTIQRQFDILRWAIWGKDEALPPYIPDHTLVFTEYTDEKSRSCLDAAIYVDDIEINGTQFDYYEFNEAIIQGSYSRGCSGVMLPGGAIMGPQEFDLLVKQYIYLQ